MNILLDDLPESVIVGGESYPIDTDFRTLIRMEQLICSEGESKQKIIDLLHLMFTERIPKDIPGAVDAVMNLYRRERPVKQSGERKNGNVRLKKPKTVDFEQDADYIFSAFWGQYGIDLNRVPFLHWWEFLALFQGLSSNQRIVEIMSIRSADLSQISNSEERDRIANLKRVYALKETRSVEDNVAMAGMAFGGF